MLGIMAVAGVLADLIQLPGIVGAFLAGLSVNAAVQDHPAKEKLEFLGKALFIPSFFIVTGFLIAPENTSAIADATGQFLGDRVLARSFGERGRQRAVDLFSIGQSVRALREIIS